MKRILLFLSIVFAPMVASATGQASDIIYIDGQQWWLMGRLTHALDSVHYYRLMSLLPELKVESTANWDCHIGYWSLDGDLLVLDSIVVEVYEDSTYKESHKESLPQSTMRKVFGDYYRNGRIEATFVTADNIRATQGKRIFYEHMGWNRHYETELVFNVEQGRVMKRTLYHNRIAVEGYYFDENDFEGFDKFKAGFAPVLLQYQELSNVDRIIFSISQWTFDTLGNMTDVDVKARCRDHEDIEPLLAAEFKQYLMSIRPWRLWYLNGEYTPISRGWHIPFRREDWQ